MSLPLCVKNDIIQQSQNVVNCLVRPEEFESPTSRLRRPVFYPVELETHCLALEVTVEGDVTYHWLGCARPRLTQGLNGATSWTRTSHTQIFSLLLYLMSYRGVELVSVAGFEPATPSPPDLCATGLRYTKKKSPGTVITSGVGIGLCGALTRYRSWVSTLPM